MLACMVGIADLCSTQVSVGHETVDQGGFPHTAVPAEQGNLLLQQRTECLYALSCLGGDGNAVIADVLIERHHHLLVTQQVGIEQVGLIEDEHHRHTISFGRG